MKLILKKKIKIVKKVEEISEPWIEFGRREVDRYFEARINLKFTEKEIRDLAFDFFYKGVMFEKNN